MIRFGKNGRKSTITPRSLILLSSFATEGASKSRYTVAIRAFSASKFNSGPLIAGVSREVDFAFGEEPHQAASAVDGAIGARRSGLIQIHNMSYFPSYLAAI